MATPWNPNLSSCAKRVPIIKSYLTFRIYTEYCIFEKNHKIPILSSIPTISKMSLGLALNCLPCFRFTVEGKAGLNSPYLTAKPQDKQRLGLARPASAFTSESLGAGSCLSLERRAGLGAGLPNTSGSEGTARAGSQEGAGPRSGLGRSGSGSGCSGVEEDLRKAEVTPEAPQLRAGGFGLRDVLGT